MPFINSVTMSSPFFPGHTIMPTVASTSFGSGRRGVFFVFGDGVGDGTLLGRASSRGLGHEGTFWSLHSGGMTTGFRGEAFATCRAAGFGPASAAGQGMPDWRAAGAVRGQRRAWRDVVHVRCAAETKTGAYSGRRSAHLRECRTARCPLRRAQQKRRRQPAVAHHHRFATATHKQTCACAKGTGTTHAPRAECDWRGAIIIPRPAPVWWMMASVRIVRTYLKIHVRLEKPLVKNPKFSSPPWRHRHCADGTHALGTVGARPEPAEWCDNSA